MRLPRVIRLLLAGSIAVFVLSTVAGVYIHQYGQRDQAAKADVIVVLGAGTLRNGSPSPATLRRTRHAAALYRRGLAPYVLCTGAYTQRHPKSEAQACADVAIRAGVPAAAILMEERSTSTEENAIETRKVMERYGFKTALVVTDNFHQFRTEILFRQQGISILLSPAQASAGPLSVRIGVLNTYREVGALAWYAIKSALGLPYTSTRF